MGPGSAAVSAPHAEGRTPHHGVVDLAFLDAAARCGVLDAHADDVADAGVAALRAAEHLDTHHSARAGVVGDIEHRLHLNHLSVSNLSGPMRYGQAVLDPVRDVKGSEFYAKSKPLPSLKPLRSQIRLRRPCLLDQFGDPPCLGPGNGAALFDQHQIAFAALVLFVMGMVLLRAGHDLSIHRMGHAALDKHRYGLVHLVADDSTGQRPDALGFAHFTYAFSFRMEIGRAHV